MKTLLIHKVFLNNPDITAYPDGVYGTMTGTPTIIPDPVHDICSGYKVIVVQVNKAGNVEILIDIPYGDATYDVSLYATVTSGTNNIPWDGKDGHGGQVPDGTALSITITYVNGLTNLPIWDQEQNPQGYVVTLERPINPSVSNPKTYWDDSNISGGSCPSGTNFIGCSPSSIGCHTWGGTDCHDKMINTWWYSSGPNTSLINVIHLSGIEPPIAFPQYRCGSGIVSVTVTVSSMANVKWFDQPIGGNLLYIGNPYVVNFDSIGIFTLYAQAFSASSSCVDSSRTAVAVGISQIPEPPTSSGGPFYTCIPGTVTLTTTNTNPNTRIDWKSLYHPGWDDKVYMDSFFWWPYYYRGFQE